jgi:hypothetical protein
MMAARQCPKIAAMTAYSRSPLFRPVMALCSGEPATTDDLGAAVQNPAQQTGGQPRVARPADGAGHAVPL